MNNRETMPAFAPDLFADRQVLVVGGTSGIGAGIAAGFLGLGARVLVTGAGAADLDIAAADSDLRGATLAVLDVRDGAAVQDCVADLPRLDVLVNCAGVLRRGEEHDPKVFADVLVNCAGVLRRGEEHDPEVFADVLDINLNGSMRTCAAARDLLRASGGCIVNTASMLSFFGGALVPAYSASKGGVAQLTKSLAIAYAADGIRVNAIAPGWIATRLTGALQADPARSDAILGRTPMKRWGTPGDVAGAVLFLASPAAGFVTGVVLPVDGGYLIN